MQIANWQIVIVLSCILYFKVSQIFSSNRHFVRQPPCYVIQNFRTFYSSYKCQTYLDQIIPMQLNCCQKPVFVFVFVHMFYVVIKILHHTECQAVWMYILLDKTPFLLSQANTNIRCPALNFIM